MYSRICNGLNKECIWHVNYELNNVSLRFTGFDRNKTHRVKKSESFFPMSSPRLQQSKRKMQELHSGARSGNNTGQVAGSPGPVAPPQVPAARHTIPPGRRTQRAVLKISSQLDHVIYCIMAWPAEPWFLSRHKEQLDIINIHMECAR